MANTEKTKAELYREERKARLAKAAKKRARKKMGKATKAVISVIVAVVIALGVCSYSFVSLGISRQMQDVYSVDDAGNVSLAEYSYYYNQVFTYYFNQAATYEQYYSSYYGVGAGAYFTGGYDYTVSPELQNLDESHSDYADVVAAGYESPTWADYFDFLAKEQVKQMKVLNSMAQKAGYKLDSEGEDEIKEAYQDVSEAAGKSMISVNKYLSIYYGKGVTKGLIKKIIKEQTIAQHYSEVLKEEYRNALTEDEIFKGYEENKEQYDVVNIAYYTVAAETVTTKDEDGEETQSVTSKTMKAAKEKAEALAASKDYKELEKAVKALNGELQDFSNVTASVVSQYLGDDAADWIADSKTKVGDIKVIEQSGSGYLVCYATALPARDDTKMVTVRQIEIAIPEEEEEETEEISEETTEDSEDADSEEAEQAKAEAEAAKAEAEAEQAKREEEDANTPALDSFENAPVFNVLADKTSDETAYKDAEIILRKYLAGDRTSDSFKELADVQSEADTSSEDYTDSSLVSDIYAGSGSVDGEVEAWALDPDRKAGDVGIIECEGEAYYVVYFVETQDESNWEMNVKDTLAYDKIQSDIDSHTTTVLDADNIQLVIDKTMVFAKKQIDAVASSSTASY